jgi:hypothetical protein
VEAMTYAGVGKGDVNTGAAPRLILGLRSELA